MKFDDFNEETKRYLQKAMDIYATIKDKNITKNVKTIIGKKNHEFTKYDKKILALFMAGLLTNGNIKEIFLQYDDIKLDYLFDFIGINENDIIPVENYEEFYDKNLKLDFMSIINGRNNVGKKINFITPEVIVNSLQFISLNGSDILDYFARSYNLSGNLLGFNEHPLFNALEKAVFIDGSVSEKGADKRNSEWSASTTLDTSPLLKTMPLTQSPKTEESTFNENLWQLLDDIKKKFIGQERAAEDIFYNIINNQELAKQNDVNDGERAIMFIDGPSGTGKTAIAREITSKLNIPFVLTTTTEYSATGYHGRDLTDILRELIDKAGGDLDKAQKGIIVIDEWDKLFSNGPNDLIMKTAVQEGLLHLMGGGKYNLSSSQRLFDDRKIEFDTSKLTFICLGALTDLRSKKTEIKHSIGFGDDSDRKDIHTFTITPQDLINMGIKKELAGRINTYLHTDDYSKEDLYKILTESAISPLHSFQKWAQRYGKKVEIEDGVLEKIVDFAYELNTGARSLQTVMNNIRTHFLKEVMRGKEKSIYIDVDTVLEINNSTITRKGR